MLRLPLLWRLAYRFIMTLSHESDRTTCIVCEADKRAKAFKHELTMNAARQFYCAKCGQPRYAWQAVCKNNGKKVGTQPAKRSPVAVFPINWN